MTAANREIYEKAMALAAAVRKGQLLPEEFRIKSPQALLNDLETRKVIKANTEAAYQYKNLTTLGLGRLEHLGNGWYQFRLIDIPENIEAVRMARALLRGDRPEDLEVDTNARILLGQNESYVKSHLTSSTLRKDGNKTAISTRAHAEIDQYMLKL